MERHTCIIGLGSNFEKERQIAFAFRELTVLFPDIRFSTPQVTSPIGITPAQAFLNATAIFTTTQTPDATIHELKRVEQMAGRKPEDKLRGVIPLDLDLLVYDKKRYRPSDLQREDVKAGIAELGVSGLLI